MTVGEALETLFPRGTTGAGTLTRAPLLPTSIFGAAAYLLEKSGAYHELFPIDGLPSTLANPLASDLQKFRDLGVRWAAAGIKLDKNKIATSRRAAHKTLLAVNTEVQTKWNELLKFKASPVTPGGGYQDWWPAAASLFVFADEAARDVGYRAQRNKQSLIDVVWDSLAKKHVRPNLACANPAMTHRYGDREKTTYAPFLDASVAGVMPKGRTPSVGCTMRALSQNLSFVSNPAALEVAWFVQDRVPAAQFEALNLLLVPFPFEISARAFKPSKPVETGNKRWGWFDVEQEWLKGFDILKLMTPLLNQAVHTQGSVQGIVLPELALNWAQYARLVEFIMGTWNPACEEHEAVQFVVCGLSESHADAAGVHTRGNYAYVTSFHRQPHGGAWEANTFGRAKHHRWKLTSTQLTEYALSSILDPEVDWWEHINLERRRLAVHVFRENTAISALICEDLARADPCHEPLRSLGPNLIVALLMDGAQLPQRWPGRYATGLADDPGSSVLTLSSLGLIERSNRTGRHTPNRTVALWKDDRGVAIPLDLPAGAQGVLLSLSGGSASEATLDGRLNSDAIALRYQCHQPVFSS